MPEYALVLLLIFVLSLFMHRKYKLRIFESKQHMIIFYLIFLIIGIAWDHVAIYRGHWSFSEEHLLGPRLGLMPIEEYLFGIIVPYFGLVIYKLVEERLIAR